MWEAAVSVNEFCVKRGKVGAAFSLGKSILIFCVEEKILTWCGT